MVVFSSEKKDCIDGGPYPWTLAKKYCISCLVALNLSLKPALSSCNEAYRWKVRLICLQLNLLNPSDLSKCPYRHSWWNSPWTLQTLISNSLSHYIFFPLLDLTSAIKECSFRVFQALKKLGNVPDGCRSSATLIKWFDLDPSLK